MVRTLALAAFAALFAGSALAGQAVALKPQPLDDDGVVTLGDLFEGAGAASATVVAPGPQGGSAVVLDAARVQAAARAAGLSWANPTGMRRIAVRAGTAPVASAAPTAGMVEALVYARSLNAGDTVRAEDLTWAPVGSHLVPGDAPRDAETAMGWTARKPLRAGAAVSARDLAAARVIAKDETVSVAYRMGGLNLVMQGKALSAAAAGDTVRILNPASKKIIEAVASGPGQAVVGPRAEAIRSAPSPLARR
ncbi:MAG TPA: flagellar basal body P-ring formation chaperone FlgA [Caulobacteraceae bacterium]|jgi:flagella basal body P-ring formation protein FlgA